MPSTKIDSRENQKFQCVRTECDKFDENVILT